MTGGKRVPRSESPSAAAPVRIGGYSLAVGAGSGSFARFEPTEERENARNLKAALTQDENELPAPVTAVEEFQETADAVTSRIEQADKLLTAAADQAAGLDPGNVNSEIDALLDLFGRLDRAGRFEEQLKLMRSLNGLLALTLRWLDLIRSLRSLLRSAEATSHQAGPAGQAFAHHELGSLNLCAGWSKAASQHLSEALRIEKHMGDFASQCATRHNLDAAHRDTLARRAWRRSRRQLMSSILVAAALVLLGGGSGTGLALAIRGGGGNPSGGGSSQGGGDHSAATLIVHENFEPKPSAASVTLSVTCTKGGRPKRFPPKTATEATPARFSITGFGEGATCTATEARVPTGYEAIESECRGVSLAPRGLVSCTIINMRKSGGPHVNTQSSATLTVSRVFSDGNQASVPVWVFCDSGASVDKTPQSALEGSPAVFKIGGFSPGATCVASERIPPSGYTADESDCQGVAITDGGSRQCTIVDKPNIATLTVRIDYTNAGPKTPVKINVSLSCLPSGGTGAETPMSALPDSPAVFTLTGFVTGATCNASGDKVSGYDPPNASDCQNVPLATKGECTIVYTPTTIF